MPCQGPLVSAIENLTSALFSLLCARAQPVVYYPSPAWATRDSSLSAPVPGKEEGGQALVPHNGA